MTHLIPYYPSGFWSFAASLRVTAEVVHRVCNAYVLILGVIFHVVLVK
jgi:hypothetical protein